MLNIAARKTLGILGGWPFFEISSYLILPQGLQVSLLKTYLWPER